MGRACGKRSHVFSRLLSKICAFKGLSRNVCEKCRTLYTHVKWEIRSSCTVYNYFFRFDARRLPLTSAYRNSHVESEENVVVTPRGFRRILKKLWVSRTVRFALKTEECQSRLALEKLTFNAFATIVILIIVVQRRAGMRKAPGQLTASCLNLIYFI